MCANIQHLSGVSEALPLTSCYNPPENAPDFPLKSNLKIVPGLVFSAEDTVCAVSKPAGLLCAVELEL